MNPSLKLSAYVVTVIGTLVFGILFAQSWRRLNAPEPVAGASRPSQARARSNTNKVAVATSTNAPGGTNAVEETVVEPAEPASESGTSDREAAIELTHVSVSGRGWSRLLLWGFFGLLSVAGLGSLAAYDFTQYAGNRATDSLFDHDGDGIPESTDDQVEKAYGDGDFLEAIRLLRDHLKTHPKSVDAQIRIAELYEKDLNNPLAAALEYEEVLKLSMSPEKRGWTCIHLVNLYNRLEKPDQSIGWLQRIVVECPGTPAAAKAQERLEAAGLEVPEAPQSEEKPPDGPPSNLPPGFRPRGS